MDALVNPALSKWIDDDKKYTRKLDIEELKKGTKGKCCPDIEAGLVIDEKMKELNTLIEKGGGAGTICVHGIGSVGKTAIATAINNQALRAPGLFDFVIWVDVSNGANLWQVQDDIASVIFEKLPANPNIANMAGKLHTALTGKKKFLLILDSMWQDSGSLEEMRNNGRRRLYKLSDASLLENASEVGKKVKMPNLIRDMALAIAGQNVFVKAGNKHANFPIVGDSPKGVLRMSFMRNRLGALVLLDSYDFNMLSMLLLQDNPFYLSHHNSLFFKCMINLKVLDLSHTGLSFLPDSLPNLSNLHALFLRNCLNLSDFPCLSDLNRLNVLDLSGTQLQQWPKDMDMLTKLRRLDLTQAKLDIFPIECICIYNQLEELLMIWDINSRGCVWGSNELGDWNSARVEWLPRLGHLADLQLVFLNVMVFNSYMNACPNTIDGYAITTTCFTFFVGGFHSAGVESNLHENSVTVIGDHHIVLLESTLVLNLMNCPDDVRSLNMIGCLRDLTILDVFGFNELTYLLTLDMWHSLGNLRKICVRRCRNMVGIIQSAEEANPKIISHPSLVELVLFDLKSLQHVHDGGRTKL
ncbi:hypothetical protein Ancab_036971 [Ancistrocladus abbreviatus]